jgi:hypothetical protein
VLVIFFAEVAKRSFTQLKNQELFTLHFMVGLALWAPFSGFLWTQYVARSDYVQALGLGAELPWWGFPSKAALLQDGNTFFTYAWLPIIALILLGMVLSFADNFGLCYVFYRLVNDVEKLPFPFAPVGAAGIMALSTERTAESAHRWRSFAIGGMIGMIWGALFLCVPMITQAILPKRIEIVPLIFLDYTQQVGKFLPATPVNIVINLGSFLGGMVTPFWGVIGGVIAVGMTAVFNPWLQGHGYLPSWRPEMSFIDTSFNNTLDFYLSFGIGLTLAVTFSQFVFFGGDFLRNWIRARPKELAHEPPFAQRVREGWRLLITNNTARGDFSIFLAFGIYVFTSAAWIVQGCLLISGYPWVLMLFYTMVYNPLISYATAKLEGLCGRAVDIPYLTEITILLSGHKGADIWFTPLPIRNVGAGTVAFRTMELTGTKLISKVKTMLVTTPIIIVASLFTAELMWRMADVPSSAYPYTQMMWELSLKQWCVIKTSTLEGGSQFLEAWHGSYVVAGFASGSILFFVLNLLGLPIMLVFGLVYGLNQNSPGAIFCTLLGALIGKFYFKRKYKDMWLQYMVVVMAGFGCGMGLTSMVAMAFTVITRMLSPTLW